MKTLAFWLPKKLVYWCVIRAWAYATQGPYSSTVATSISASEVLNRWPVKP